MKVQILLGYQQTLTAVNDLVMRGRGSHEEEEGWLTFTYDPKDFKLIHHITDGGELHETKRRRAGGGEGGGGGGGEE